MATISFRAEKNYITEYRRTFNTDIDEEALVQFINRDKAECEHIGNVSNLSEEQLQLAMTAYVDDNWAELDVRECWEGDYVDDINTLVWDIAVEED